MFELLRALSAFSGGPFWGVLLLLAACLLLLVTTICIKGTAVEVLAALRAFLRVDGRDGGRDDGEPPAGAAAA